VAYDRSGPERESRSDMKGLGGCRSPPGFGRRVRGRRSFFSCSVLFRTTALRLSLDPWFLHRLLHELSYLLRHVGNTYYVSRLPWMSAGAAWPSASRAGKRPAALQHRELSPVERRGLSLDVRLALWAVVRDSGCCLAGRQSDFMATVAGLSEDGHRVRLRGFAFRHAPARQPRAQHHFGGVFLALSRARQHGRAPMISRSPRSLCGGSGGRPGTGARKLSGSAGSGTDGPAPLPSQPGTVGRWTFFYWQIYQTIESPSAQDAARALARGAAGCFGDRLMYRLIS